ncbi:MULTISPECIES: choice-of-anchor G family protein [unclassified Microbacterium]|uniref:choice-of-anchor G family protein n=1 Tax=unclassified Microbacterium TaxID=2609290 RepID=UPI001AC61DB0|nr:choice-of-anchor G family protein [Microbacterium sp.]MBN9157283.1 choice-of-anchor G family protein [Microbacterium sp.]MBS1896467.1 choice-of-anchor G family protein [Actinomycetota bacterium]
MVDAEGARDEGAARGVSRRTIMKGAAWTVPALMVATAAPAYAVSCDPGKWNVVGRGKMLSGGFFNLNFDTLLSVDGSIASAPGLRNESGFKHNPPSHAPVGPGGVDEHTDPLSVTALGGLNVNLTGVDVALASILDFILKPDVGALNQYSYGSGPDSESRGASGFVDDHGIVRTTTEASYPDFSTIKLKDIIASLIGSGPAGQLANLADLELQVGAIAARAVLVQACNNVTDPSGYRLHRDYLLAHLRLTLTSDLLSTLVTTINNILNSPLIKGSVETALGLLATVVAQVQYPLTGNGQGQFNTSTLTGNIPSGVNQPIQLNLGDGKATIDIGALLGGSAFGASDPAAWINNLPPNTILFADPGYQLPTNAIDNFIQGIAQTLDDIIQNTVRIRTRNGFGAWGPWMSLTDVVALADPLGLIGAALQTLFSTLAGIITGALNVATAPVKLLLNWLLDDVLENTLRISINVQNNPGANNNPATPGFIHNAPTRWTTGSTALEAGRFDVAAISLNALDVVKGLDLFLARGSVGPHTPTP